MRVHAPCSHGAKPPGAKLWAYNTWSIEQQLLSYGVPLTAINAFATDDFVSMGPGDPNQLHFSGT
eukprot:1534319-Prorocentrum_lima.AAC.1